MSDMPEVGKRAPAFSGVCDQAGKIRLSNFKGESNVVLYFYPKDDTPGCTKESCSFKDNISKIKRRNAVVIGVSPDGKASHEKFRSKYGLPFYLVSDEDHAICEKYGVWVEKNMYGRKYMGVQRATFLIDKDGKIAASWPKVKVEGHTDQVLEALDALK